MRPTTTLNHEAGLESARKLYGHPLDWPLPSRAPLRWWVRIFNGDLVEEEDRLEHLFGPITQEMRDRFFAEPGQSFYEDAGGAMLRRYRAMLGLPVERQPSNDDVMSEIVKDVVKTDLNLRISGEISALRLNPTDKIVVSAGCTFTHKQKTAISKMLTEIFVGHDIIIVDGGMTIEPMRVASPDAIMASAKRQFDRVSRQALCKDVGAAADYPEVAQRYLEAAKAFYGDAKEYRDIHAAVTAITDQLVDVVDRELAQ